MSRTDKDRPWLLRANDGHPLAYFRHLCGPRACDAEQDPLAQYKATQRWPRCGWTLPYIVFVTPPRDYINEVWRGPERRRERDDLRMIAREYNAHGDVDGDFPNNQHRHGATWTWW